MELDIHGNPTDRDIQGNRPRDGHGNELDRPLISPPSWAAPSPAPAPASGGGWSSTPAWDGGGGGAVAAPGASNGSLGGFLGVVVLVVVLMGAQAAGGVLHGLHVKVGMEDAPGDWIYLVAAVLLVAAMAARARRGRGAVLRMTGALLLLAGACTDQVIIHGVHGSAAAAASSVPPGAQLLYLHGDMYLRAGPGTDHPVRSTLPRGARVLLGPKDANGWAVLYRSPDAVPNGYVYRASDMVRSYAP